MEKPTNHFLKRALSPTRNNHDSSQILQLIRTTQKLLLKNRALHLDLLEKDPYFVHDLYKPKKQCGVSKSIQKQLRLQQIDQLLDEQFYLTQKRQEKTIRKQFAQERELKAMDHSSPFSFKDLKKILSCFKTQGLCSSERIEEMNKVMKQIKCKVDCEIENQNSYARDGHCVNQNIQVCWKKYSKLESEYKEALIENQRNSLKLHDGMEEKNKQIEALTRTINELKNMIKDKDSIILEKQKSLEQMQRKQQQIFNAQTKSIHFQNQSQNFIVHLISKDKPYQNYITTKSFDQVFSFLKSESLPSIQQIELPFLNLESTSVSIKKILSDRNWTEKALTDSTTNKSNEEEESQNLTLKFKQPQWSLSLCQSDRLRSLSKINDKAVNINDRKNRRFKRNQNGENSNLDV